MTSVHKTPKRWRRGAGGYHRSFLLAAAILTFTTGQDHSSLLRGVPVVGASASVVSSSGTTATAECGDVPHVTGRALLTTTGEGEEGTLSTMVVETSGDGGEAKQQQHPLLENLRDVYGCCTREDPSSSSSSLLKPQIIGSMPQYTTTQALTILNVAREAWNGGTGVWPTMSLSQRIDAIEKFVEELLPMRRRIIDVLMWEIGKNEKDATSEFDRTIGFVRQAIEIIRTPNQSEYNNEWDVVGKTRAFVRRAAIGIWLCLGPFNYPLNETYATLIPALLMGNVVIMKIPTVGGLAHLLTMEAFAKSLPPGTIQFISGSGRETMPPLMKTGYVDGLAFIGGSNAADELIRDHPHPHRLKLFLQLEAKNMAIFLPDMFEGKNVVALDKAIDETVLGSLSYNGQRCTALKLIFVPKEYSSIFAKKLGTKVEELRVGLPWENNPNITPLPNQKRVAYMKSLIDDAKSKGASVMNSMGGTIVGGSEGSTLMIPAVLHPVTEDMDAYIEEQFGPVVPVAPYDDIDTVLRYARDGKYGQQCSIFTTMTGDAGDGNSSVASMLVDKFASVFGKININSQCGRSPDTLPFSGRRSSALGVMSVTEALREFSVPTVVAYKEDVESMTEKVVRGIQQSSNFMQPL